MKKFVATFTLTPAVRVDPSSQNIDLTFNEVDGTKRVIISKIEEMKGGQSFQTGIFLRVFIDAENVKEAKEHAKVFVDGVIGFITLVAGVGLQTPNECLAYEVTPNVQKREFLQTFFDPAKIQPSRRTLDHKLLAKIIDHIFKIDSYSNRCVARAIRWYRMGTLTFDIFDKYSCFWIGLEALNPILQQKLSVKDDLTTCPNPLCGYKWVSSPTISGIRTFIKDRLHVSSIFYQRFHNLRIELMHSKCELSKIQNDALELTPKLAETLFRAICFVLDIEDWQSLPYRSILENVPIRIEFEGKLVGCEPSSLGTDGKDPYLEPSHEMASIKVLEDGSITFEGVSNFAARIEPFKAFELSEIRMYGDKEIKGAIKSTEVKNKDKID
jgi:hypothetical protein